jgi:hypothetical protein
VEDKRNADKTLVGKHEGKRQLRQPRFRWEKYTEINLKNLEWECVDCDNWAQNTIMNLRVPQN